MTTTRRAAILLGRALLALCLVPIAHAAQKADLGVELEPGEVLVYDFETRSTMALSMFGQAQTTRAHMDARVSITPLNLTPTGGTVQLTYDRVAVGFEGGMAPGSFDSEDDPSKDPGNIYAPLVRPLVGKPLTLHLNEDYEITRVQGLGELAPRGVEGVLFGQLFGEEAMKAMFEPIFRLKPGDDHAGVGETWTVEHTGAGTLGMRGRTLELTLDSLAGETGVISIDGRIDPETHELPGEVEIERSDISGAARFDVEHHRLDALETTHNLRAKAGQGGQGISVTLDLRGATALEFVEVTSTPVP